MISTIVTVILVSIITHAMAYALGKSDGSYAQRLDTYRVAKTSQRIADAWDQKQRELNAPRWD